MDQNNMIIKLYQFIKLRKKFLNFCFLKLFVLIIGLITNIIIVRKFSLIDYGSYNLSFMIVALAASFGFSWSSSSLIYYGSKEKAQTGSMNKTFWARNIILFFSLFIITLVFMLFYNKINTYVQNDIAYLMLIWVFIKALEDYIGTYFLSVEKQLLSTAMIFSARIIFLIFILCFSFDFKTLIMLNIFSDATIIFYLVGINKKDIGKFDYDHGLFKEILAFSLWQFFGFSGLYIINFGDNIVINHFMSIEDVGLYNSSYKLFNGIASLSYVVASFYGAHISACVENCKLEQLKLFFFKERFIIVALSIILHIIIIIFADKIIYFFYRPRYNEVVSTFIILLFGSIFRYISVFYMIYCNSTKNYKVQQGLNILRAGLNVLLDIIFIQRFGINGTAMGTTFAILITLILSMFICEKGVRDICNISK